MANVNRQWQRFLAVGCSHGHLQDDDAVKAVLKFRKSFKPHRVIHLGDFVDTAAFRGGAMGTPDEAVELSGDMAKGLSFLKALEPTDVLLGNHEDRLYQTARHYNAIKAYAAQEMIDEIRNTLRPMRTNFVESYDTDRAFIELGNYKLLHGWWFNVHALRDHSEHYGNVIMAHLHTPSIFHGKRLDRPIGYCTGMLADRDRMGYAHHRRATSTWGLGFVWGEYCDEECFPNLSQARCGNALNWRLPV